jgi:hypothetical protein
MEQRISAGELSKKALADKTNYNVLEVAHAICEDIEEELYKSARIYKDMIDEEEYCVVRVIGKDNLISNANRYLFYCWPYLPSPRPDQSVFLYNKNLDLITKRLWILPNAARMALLATTTQFVPKEYQTMQAWSVAFFKGTFWEYVRHDQKIDMPSEHEYFLEHREELIKAGCKIPDSTYSEPFDFSKIEIKNIIDTKNSVVS